MNTSYLVPGYVHQGFAKAHIGLAKGCDWGEQYLKNYAKIPVKIIDKSLKWVEWPIKIFEDVALTAINLAGATLSKGCRKNLKYCIRELGQDLKETVIKGLIIYFPLLLKCYLITQIAISLLQPLKKSIEKFVAFSNFLDSLSMLLTQFFEEWNSNIFYDTRLECEKNDREFYRVSAIRKHGFDNINDLKKALHNLEADYRNRILYKNIFSVETKDFEEALGQVEYEMRSIVRMKDIINPYSPNYDPAKEDELYDEIRSSKNKIVTILNS